MYKYILFDLDGTLLSMDNEDFTKKYLSALAKKMALYGFEPQKLIDSIWRGVSAMVKNDGTKSNEKAFWDKFEEIYQKDIKEYIPYFDAFYRNEFIAAKEACEINQVVPNMINSFKNKGIKIIIATNPIFPSIATERRIEWAGLNKKDFELVTTYENSNFCKPNIKYYEEILNKINAKPEECLMVGNDVLEDMVAKDIGIDVFLITKNLINKNNIDISNYNHGEFNDLMAYVESK